MNHVKHAHLSNFGDSKVNLGKPEVDRQRKEISELRELIEKKIAEDPSYGLHKVLHAGSVAKGTAITRGGDRDLAIYVKTENAPEETSDLVIWLRDGVRSAYPDLDPSNIQAVTNCVEVVLPSGLKVDVVPILYEGEEDDVGYLIRKGSGARVRTSVRLHLDFIRDRKKKYPHLAQNIRFTKWWVQHKRDKDADFKCKSFMLELIWIYLADNHLVELDDHVRALEGFFGFIAEGGLKNQIAFTDYLPVSSLPMRGDRPIQVLDPVNFENNVGVRYKAADYDKLVKAASDAYDVISTAHYDPDESAAETLWQEVMGRMFKRTA